MSESLALERSVLERKERDELATIAQALGLKPAARAAKATIVDQILRSAGVDLGVEEAPKARRGRKPKAETDATPELSSEDDPGAEPNGVTSTPAGGRSSAASGLSAADRPARGPRRAPASTLFDPFAEVEAAGAAVVSDDELFSAASAQPSTNGARDADPADGLASSERVGSRDGGSVDDGGRDGGERTERGERPDRPERTDRPERNDRPVRSERPDRGPRPDRPARDVQARDGQAPRPAQGGGQGQGAGPGGGQGAGQGQGGQGQGGQGADRFRFDDDLGGSRNRRKRRRGREREPQQRMDPQRDAAVERLSETYSGDLLEITGLLDLDDKGYGYIRAKGYLASANDVYVPVNKAKQLGLRKGDMVTASYRPALPQEKFAAIVNIDQVAGVHPDVARLRPKFEELTPLFPDVRLRLETPGETGNMVSRIVDLISPIGKGQRGLIVSPPKAGKTTIMKQIAVSIERNNPEVHLMVLLVDERPEEVTDMRRTVKTAEVVASTFDRPGDEHTMLAELAIERAKRLVEAGKDVFIILDGITRLARAYNFAAPATGRIMSGGLDAGALYPPKRFFGAARNVEEGGSLTILATALIETGSLMDNVIFEEFKGTGNMELRLDRRLAEKRIFPAINVNESSTRHDELLFTRPQSEAVTRLRRVLIGLAQDGSAEKGLEILMERLKTTGNNDVFLAEIAKAPQTPA